MVAIKNYEHPISDYFRDPAAYDDRVGHTAATALVKIGNQCVPSLTKVLAAYPRRSGGGCVAGTRVDAKPLAVSYRAGFSMGASAEGRASKYSAVRPARLQDFQPSSHLITQRG